MSIPSVCQYDGCTDDSIHRCAICDLWTCEDHFEHGPIGDGPHLAVGSESHRIATLEAELTRLREENERLKDQRDCFATNSGIVELEAGNLRLKVDSLREENERLKSHHNAHRRRAEKRDQEVDVEIMRYRTAIQSKLRELTAIAVSLERGGGDAWRTREKIRGWEEVLNANS